MIIDYFTCTIVPVAFLYRFDILPSKTVGPIGFAVLFVSALWMSRTDQETTDGWFYGFPAEWNMIIPTLYLLHPNPWLNLGICVAFIALKSSTEPAHDAEKHTVSASSNGHTRFDVGIARTS